ncbi:MAG TPA: class I SAM-dependent methyltransferase, partial [Candidatus Paceibacterota bacterium]|nr:class I SAM-dependent methyltransferase [Candidatus Paceibacterota bacterium]
VQNDEYWGEFPEKDLDVVLDKYRRGDSAAARARITELGRDDFVFGFARSDFLYGLDIGPGKRVLDIGCGLGVHSFNAARTGAEVYGCDLSSKRAEFCMLRAKSDGVENAHFFHSDILNLPFAAESFDAVVLNGVVEWLGEMNRNKDPRQDQIEGLKSVLRILKPGGTLYIGIENRIAATYLFHATDHNRLKYTTFMPRFLADFVTRRKKGKSYRTYTYAKGGYEKLLRDSGFSNPACFYIAHPGYNLPQYLIPFGDTAALCFVLNSMSIDKGMRGAFVRAIAVLPGMGKITRNFFYSYAMYVKK